MHEHHLIASAPKQSTSLSALFNNVTSCLIQQYENTKHYHNEFMKKQTRQQKDSNQDITFYGLSTQPFYECLLWFAYFLYPNSLSSQLVIGWVLSTSSRRGIPPVVVKHFECGLVHATVRVPAGRQRGIWLVLSIWTFRQWLAGVFTGLEQLQKTDLFFVLLQSTWFIDRCCNVKTILNIRKHVCLDKITNPAFMHKR